MDTHCFLIGRENLLLKPSQKSCTTYDHTTSGAQKLKAAYVAMNNCTEMRIESDLVALEMGLDQLRKTTRSDDPSYFYHTLSTSLIT